MTLTKNDKTITKPYPPQISRLKNQVLIYSPLEHWIELHSSKSITNMIEIDGNSSSYFMNRSNKKILLQNQYALMSEQQIEQNFSKVYKIYEHSHAFASETVYLNDQYYVNIDQTGSLNLFPLNNLQHNPQSFKQISTKTSIQFSSLQSIELAINIDNIFKRYQNGHSLANLAVEDERIFTLHMFKDQEQQSYSKIYKTDINQSECITNALRAHLPQNMKGLFAEGNSIWAYGSDNLLLLDNRSESIVSRMNNLLGTDISYVKKHNQNSNLLYVCRDNTILLQDARKGTEIVEIVLISKQNVGSFEVIEEEGNQIYCVNSPADGKVHFYQKTS